MRTTTKWILGLAVGVLVSGCASVAPPDTSVAGNAGCAVTRPSVQLDHGPRAQITPYVAHERQQRYETALKACRSGRAA